MTSGAWFLVLLALGLSGVAAHSTRYAAEGGGNWTPDSPPPLRRGWSCGGQECAPILMTVTISCVFVDPNMYSWHVHVMMPDRHNGGAAPQLTLRKKFIAHFNISELDCEGDFDQGRLCMFPIATEPFGPFPIPQWSAFVPLDNYPEVSAWMLQHRGTCDLFMHPNTGFEREDHLSWSWWSGRPWTLIPADPEFQEELTRTSAMDDSRHESPLMLTDHLLNIRESYGRALMRVFNAADRGVSPVVLVLEGQQGHTLGKSPVTSRMDQSWFEDWGVGRGAVLVRPVVAETGRASGRGKAMNMSMAYSTLVVWGARDGQLNVMQIEDRPDVSSKQGGQLRVVNMADDDIVVRVDGVDVASSVSPHTASKYVLVKEGQRLFEAVIKGHVQLLDPLYVNSEVVLTLWFVLDDTGRLRVVMSQDFPKDA